MQAKSTKGVQQDDVWGAADELVREKLRPTIERVRLKIGRGSPNTVSPLLDTWFATLGSRLGLTEQNGPKQDEFPAPVHQAMLKLWQSACAAAQQNATQDLLSAQQVIAEERSAINQREQECANQEIASKQRQSAQEQTLELAREQIADLSTRLEQSQALGARRDAEIEALESRMLVLGEQRDAEKAHSDETLRLHAQERQRLQEHGAQSERRLMMELDRERQESKRLHLNLQQTEQRVDAMAREFEAQRAELTQKLQTAQSELRSAREALDLSHERGDELRGLLEEQRTSNNTVMAQLSQLLSEAASKRPASAKPKKKANLQASAAK